METEFVGDRNLVERTLAWSELFASWPRETVVALANTCHIARYMKREQLLTQQSLHGKIFVIAGGFVEVARINADGRKFIHALLGPGKVVRLTRLLTNADPVKVYEYFAHEQSTIVFLPATSLLEQLEAHPALWADVAKLLLHRRVRAMQTLERQALTTLRQRTAQLLCELSTICGEADGSGVTMKVKLTQDDLASMLGVSRQSANKELMGFEERGLIGATRRNLKVLNIERLQLEASLADRDSSSRTG